jgi:hypothetical protein
MAGDAAVRAYHYAAARRRGALVGEVEESMAVAIDGDIFQDAYPPRSTPRAKSI